MDTYVNNLKRLNPSLNCRVVSSDDHVDEVWSIEKAVFPLHMQDSLDTLKSFFATDDAHGIIIYSKKAPVGVLKGHHLSLANTAADVLDAEDLKTKHDVTFYMDSVGVLESVRSTRLLDFLMHEMAVDMRRFDYQYVTAHARVKGGLSRLYRRRYKAKVLATYDDWSGFGEAFDYILVDLKNVPVQSQFRRTIYGLIRKITNKL